jgi:hypothetical protein
MHNYTTETRSTETQVSQNQKLDLIGGLLKGSLILTVSIITFLVLAPNYALFSSDDLGIGMQANPLMALATDQASNGRFTFWAALRFCSLLGVPYPEYLSLSGVIFFGAILYLQHEVFALLKIENFWAQTIGTLSLVTFCLNQDIYQFKEAYLSYGLSFAFGALAIRTAKSDLHYLNKIFLCSIYSTLSVGAYQIFLQVFIMIVAVWVLSWAADRQSKRDQFAILTLSASVVLGAIIYVIANNTLRVFAIDGFSQYPARAQGAKYVVGNIGAYLQTTIDIWVPFQSSFQPLSNSLISIGWAVVCMLLFRIVHRRSAGYKSVVVIVVVAGAMLCAPNPANLMMETYWPSPRSVAGIAFFVSVASRSRDFACELSFGHLSAI